MRKLEGGGLMGLFLGVFLIIASLASLIKIIDMITKVELAKIGKEDEENSKQKNKPLGLVKEKMSRDIIKRD